MTIADNYEPIKQETNGVATQFSFDFYALNETFIKVYLETDGVQTLVNSTDYEITFTENGGVVAFYDPPAAGSYIIITRDTPREQETPFYTSSGFPAKTVEGRLDKLTAMVQELQDNVDRSAKVPVGNDVDITLPVPDDGKALVWDGTALANSDETLQAISDKATGAYTYAQEAKGYRDQASASATLAEEWAIKTDAPVDNNEYSAKYHAQASASSAAASAESAIAAQEAVDGKVDLDAANLSTAGKSLISGFGMPSNRHDDLTLGASGTSYTAPANGWFWYLSSGMSMLQMRSYDKDGNYLYNYQFGTTTQTNLIMGYAIYVPKGGHCNLYYTRASGATLYQWTFVYARGEIE